MRATERPRSNHKGQQNLQPQECEGGLAGEGPNKIELGTFLHHSDSLHGERKRQNTQLQQLPVLLQYIKVWLILSDTNIK